MNTDWLFEVLQGFHPYSGKFRPLAEPILKFITLPAKHYLAEAHQFTNNVYFLQKGFARSFVYSGGEEITTRFWNPGSIIVSPDTFYNRLPARECIQLLEESELIYATWEDVKTLNEHSIDANALAVTAKYAQEDKERMYERDTLSAWERYLRLRENFDHIEQKASQYMIASNLGIHPSSLSRLKRQHK